MFPGKIVRMCVEHYEVNEVHVYLDVIILTNSAETKQIQSE